MLEQKIVELKKKILEYAGLVESMIEKSIKGLQTKDKELLSEIINVDEHKANDYEIEIDELCIHIIAQYEPKARDLRIVLMILKMNNDLERIGDHAVNIAQSAIFLIDKPLVKPLIDIPRMAQEAINMLKNSINSFVNKDLVLAKEVCKRDDIVDGLKTQIFRELITYMISDSKTIERCLELTRITNNLERISDLSTNICEDVIFMVEGKVIKHHHTEKNKKTESK